MKASRFVLGGGGGETVFEGFWCVVFGFGNSRRDLKMLRPHIEVAQTSFPVYPSLLGMFTLTRTVLNRDYCTPPKP